MIANYSTMATPYRHVKSHSQICGISMLLAAAVVNKRFRTLLLTDPQLALSQGYYGETFPLTSRERKLVLSIKAENLSDFARQITSRPENVEEGGCGQWAPVNQPALVFEAE